MNINFCLLDHIVNRGSICVLTQSNEVLNKIQRKNKYHFLHDQNTLNFTLLYPIYFLLSHKQTLSIVQVKYLRL